MRIIKEKTLLEYCKISRYSVAREPLQAWISEVRYSEWSSPAELKASYNSASIIGSRTVVFNIKGNIFRLVTHINYKHAVVFIIWFGTHEEYNRIDVKTIRYGG